jgi:ribosomal protein S18 acetylase RimI-like enzyme
MPIHDEDKFELREANVADDADFFFEVRNDIDLQRLLLSNTETSTCEEVNNWLLYKISDEQTIFRVIADKLTGSAIGYLQLARVAYTNNYYLGICCSSNFRGRGAGRKSVRDALEILRPLKANKVLLEVDKYNYRAISLYNSEGFRTVGELLRHISIREEFIDVVIMEKLI